MKLLVVVLLAALCATLFAFHEHGLTRMSEGMIYAALPACNGFVAVYAFRPWYRSQVGRALMTKACAVALLFDLSAAAHLFHWVVPLRLGVFVIGALVLGIWYQFLVLCTTPRDKPLKEKYEDVP